MRRECGRGEAGLSLIEVLVSLLLLSLAMTGGLGMTQAGQSGLDAGRRLSAAIALAQAEVEGMNLQFPSGPIGPTPLTRETADGMKITRRIEGGMPGANLFTLRVEVTWRDGAGRDHVLPLAALQAAGRAP